MKRTIFTLFILIAIAPAVQAQEVSFQEKMAITDLVARWNSALHMSTIDQLNSLYAPEVLINGVAKTRETCIKEKSNLVNQFAGLHQEIISPIDISFYHSGAIKCSFTKRVQYRDTVTDYQSYLLLQKVGDGHYQITGEGGHESEQSLKAGVKLGEEVSPPPTTDFTWVIFCSATFLLVVFVVWMMGKSRMAAYNFVHPRTISKIRPITPEKIIKSRVHQKIEAMTNPVPTMNVAETTTVDEPDEGRRFEEFILNKFPKDTFNLVERRREKLLNGKATEVSRYPDLQLELKGQSEKFPFAVECKWRNDFWKGIIEWARDAQISSYQEFQTSRQMPVFIALGVGGTPDNPRHLFIIPLSHLYQSILTQNWLKKYKRESRGDFSLNLDPIMLK